MAPATSIQESVSAAGGDYFGEIGLLGEMGRTASVTAQTPVDLLALDGDGFQRLISVSREAYDDLRDAAQRRLLQTATRF
ncbi:MAG: cyclic nucleotide-binding domain-containing protein [Armatimonadetes bacterium]|nr:cyclic nucleotide-binding domain-containing protein [Armatimonadota bacterium]